MSTSVPKAVLYYAKDSVWSNAVRLAIIEKGYGEDEVDLKLVDLNKGENFAPSFLRLNAKATVPTLIVPLEKTLSVVVESRYKAITDVKTLLEFLDKSRSATSHTQTTSSAPAPSLSPATISLSTISKQTIDTVLLSQGESPDALLFLGARNLESLRALARDTLPSLKGRQDALVRYISENETQPVQVSQKVRAFWQEKKAAVELLLEVMVNAEKDSAELSPESQKARENYFASAKNAWEVTLREALTALNKEIVSSYTLGDQISLADIHLAAWLAQLVHLSGGQVSDEGALAIGRLEKHIGGDISLPRLASFWDTIKQSAGWKKVYTY